MQIGLEAQTVIWNCTNHYRDGVVFRRDYTRLTRCKTISELYQDKHFSKGPNKSTGKRKIKVLNEENQLLAPADIFESAKINQLESAGVQPTYEIETYNGAKIKAAFLQRFLCFEFQYKDSNNMRFLPLAYLTTGHRIAVDSNQWGNGLMWEEIKDIKKCENSHTFIITAISKFNNIVANGFIVATD